MAVSIKKGTICVVAMVVLGAALVGCGQKDDQNPKQAQQTPAATEQLTQPTSEQPAQPASGQVEQGTPAKDTQPPLTDTQQPKSLKTQPTPKQVTTGGGQ